MSAVSTVHRCFLILSSVGIAVTLFAAGKNLADYPLRLHVFARNETTFYHLRTADEAKGEGRGNLFENSEARGIDFQFDCSRKLMVSSGYETYPAKWKKPNEQLEILVPEFGKSDSYSTCTLKVQLKDFAYFRRNGLLNSEPIAVYKQWMTKHDYDPEHGKNVPADFGEPPASNRQQAPQ